MELDVRAFWSAVLRQDAAAMRGCFCPDAAVCWHNTNERFTVEEYLRANCEYPGEWEGEIERIVPTGDCIVTVTHVWPRDRSASFHAVSFFRVSHGKIAALDEYWGNDGPPPTWRQELKIGKSIN